MKKILSLILAGVMAVTGCVLGYAPVEAAPVQGTSGDPADAGSAAYREGEALVLMKETSAVSRNRAKSVLGADDGIRLRSLVLLNAPFIDRFLKLPRS